MRGSYRMSKRSIASLRVPMENNQARICVPICVKNAHDLDDAISRAVAVGDIIEVRLDCLEPFEFEPGLEAAEQLTRRSNRPTIMTFRPAEHGGPRELDYASRYVFWGSRICRAQIISMSKRT